MNSTQEILSGLMKSSKSISPKYLYDERGSEIFEQICELEEYYPIHSETEILKKHAREMAKVIGPGAVLIEPGCGNCVKVEYLLKELETPAGYVALDISGAFLKKTAARLQTQFPTVPIYPVAADYTHSFSLPEELKTSKQKRVIFFPGSTIGNLDPVDAQALLIRMGRLVQKDGGLLIGVDLKKDAETLQRAYDDPKGVTAEFNFNLLDRLNREFSGSFDRNNFEYLARYNADAGRVEMFLISLAPQSVRIADQTIHLNEKEPIHTENSYKYTPTEFIALTEACGYTFEKLWMDQRKRFCVYYFKKQ